LKESGQILLGQGGEVGTGTPILYTSFALTKGYPFKENNRDWLFSFDLEALDRSFDFEDLDRLRDSFSKF
jgi:hypothetical protein